MCYCQKLSMLLSTKLTIVIAHGWNLRIPELKWMRIDKAWLPRGFATLLCVQSKTL